MKTPNYFYSITLYLLVSLIMIQSSLIAQPIALDTKQLDSYFTRLKRGVKCFIKRTSCKPEDKKAVYQAIGAILLALGTGIGLYYLGRNPYKALPQEVKNQKLLDASLKGNALMVEKLLKASADSNFTNATGDSPLRSVIAGIIMHPEKSIIDYRLTLLYLLRNGAKYENLLKTLQKTTDPKGIFTEFYPFEIDYESSPYKAIVEQNKSTIEQRLKDIKELLIKQTSS